MTTSLPTTEIQSWPIDRFVPYARNPRKNDAAVDRMCGNIRDRSFIRPMGAATGQFEKGGK
jgi:hypothetical protein